MRRGLLLIALGCGGPDPDCNQLDMVGDGIDQNCDGVDGLDADGDRVAAAVSGGMDCDDASAGSLGKDRDDDGWPACLDCNDRNPNRNPDGEERCNGADDDCDGTIDLDPDGVPLCDENPPALGPVDVLLVVDHTASVAEARAQLASEVGLLVARLQTEALDFHVGVISTDMQNPLHRGRLRGAGGERYIDADSVEPDATLSAMVGSAESPSSTSPPTGRDATWTALALERDGANEGFRRLDATLDIVLLTDDLDHSTEMSVAETLDWLGRMPGPRDPRVHGILTPPSGCPSGTPGDDTWELVEATGGAAVSICDPSYAGLLAQLGEPAR